MARAGKHRIKGDDPGIDISVQVPDLSTQLRASRAYGWAMEAQANCSNALVQLQNAQQAVREWTPTKDKAIAEYIAVVNAAKAKLPSTPEGKQWIDRMDAETRELKFTLEDLPKEV